MSEDPDLKTRLASLQARQKPRRRLSLGAGTLGLALSLGGAGVAYWLAAARVPGPEPLQTSSVEAFQDGGASAGRLTFPPEPAEAAPQPAPMPTQAPAPAPAPDPAVLKELAALHQTLAESRSAGDAAVKAAIDDLRAAYAEETAALQRQFDARDAERAAAASDAEARIAGLQSLIDAERAQRESLEAELGAGALRAEQALADDQLRREAEARRLAEEDEAAALLAAQIRAPAVVYAGRAEARSAQGSQAPASKPGPRPLTGDEAFLAEPRPLVVAEAARMTDPGRTLAQGTVIEAALQTAIDSDLPGDVVAVVTDPVPAFSGDAILIPRGARLFGRYKSGLEIGQKRILILWTRILTPDGTSIEIASVGGDRLGRSGAPGEVDAKFAARFGGAALVSLIGAAPSLAAKRAKNDLGAEVLSDIGGDLADATGSVIAQQMSLAPTIRVRQGASVTVLVDRDVALY